MKVEVSEPDGQVNGFSYVDLGLPSGTKWAICNYGTNIPNEYGISKYLGEGLPSDITKSQYGELNYKELQKRNIIHGKNLDTKYDIVNQLMGGQWHLPTIEDVEELMTLCKWHRLSYNGKVGWMVTGPNKHSIFLPNTLLNSEDKQDYLTSTITDTGRIYTLDLDRYVEPEPGIFTTSVSLNALIRGVTK